MESESDVASTVYGTDTDAGTETESVASSYASARNRKKKEKKKAAAAARKAAATGSAQAPAAASGASSSTGVVFEYVSASDELANPDFASVFSRFSRAEELLNREAEGANGANGEGGAGGPSGSTALAAAKAAPGGGVDGDGENGENGDAGLSKRAKKKLKRLSIAELKQLVARPDVVEAWDVTGDDPRLLVHLKSCRNSIPVPKHWSQKRKFLMGKRGMEKPPFQLPEFIAATGIEKIRNSVLEKENAKKLKGKMKERMQPKMGKIDIDYQVLHDAFFKHQTKPILTRHGDIYYEGKEHEGHLRAKRPGVISAELAKALDMAADGPPPWLVNMQRYGPPPSYASLKIPGLNAPIPEGASYGYHAGGWGKPPVDEFGRPLYGDVFGNADATSTKKEALEPGVSLEPWGAMEAEDDDDDDDDDDEGGLGLLDGSADGATEDEIADGISSVTSTTPSGVATPESSLQLRKTLADGVGTPSATSASGVDTPESTAAAPALFQVLQQTDAKIGSAAFGSSHTYVVPPTTTAAAPAAAAGKRTGRGGADGGVALALDPAELEKLDEGALRARYESLRAAEKQENAAEDVSDIIAEHERKRKRKLDAQRAADKKR